MGRDEIRTVTDSATTGTDQDYKHVTGTDIEKSGVTKRTLDLNLQGVGGEAVTLPIPTQIVSPISAFGELTTEEVTPQTQIDAVYGLRTVTDVEVYTVGTGTIATVIDNNPGREFKVSSGTDAGGIGRLWSKRVTQYRPGQGSEFRFTARFSTPVTGNIQKAGPMNIGNSHCFCYNASGEFGIEHSTGGRQEVQTLTVTVAATGNETATVTLDGTAFTPSLTSGTIRHNAYELASATYTGWTAFQNGDTVSFISDTIGDKTGSFSLSSTGTAAGTFAETFAGTVATTTFRKQTAWTENKLLNLEDSPFILDPTFGNVFQAQIQYLGYGGIVSSVEVPGTRKFIEVDIMPYANSNVTPSFDNPTFKVGWVSENTTSTTDVPLFGGSGAGFIEGPKTPARNSDSHILSQTGIGTSFISVFNMRVKRVYDGQVNLQEITPILGSVASDGTKPAEAIFVINPTLAGEPDWNDHNSFGLVELDSSALAVTVGANSPEIAGLPLGRTEGRSFNFADLEVRLSPGDILTVAVRATAGTNDPTASISWKEG